MKPLPLKAAGMVSATALCLAAGSAASQSACGASYEIQPGETLYDISQKCRVGLTRIMELNPGVDARDIAVGAEIRLAGEAGTAEGSAAGDAQPRGRYTVQEGDTAQEVAERLGISLLELLQQNEDLGPLSMVAGEVLDLPAGDRQATVSVTPSEGPPGTEVGLRAQGLRPEDYVTLGVGRTASEWQRIREVQVAADGEVSAEVAVPDWAEPGALLTFVVDTDRGLTFKSGDFRVVAPEDGSEDGVALEGRTASGVECMTLTTPDGDLYSLVSDDVEISPGEYVEIRGTRAEMSFCQQGLGTIRVSYIREVPAPQD